MSAKLPSTGPLVTAFTVNSPLLKFTPQRASDRRKSGLGGLLRYRYHLGRLALRSPVQ